MSYYYEVSVHTGDVFTAGTDAEVFVRMVGVNGSSQEIQLPTKTGHLERGM